jgi:hypothetical protein
MKLLKEDQTKIPFKPKINYPKDASPRPLASDRLYSHAKSKQAALD